MNTKLSVLFFVKRTKTNVDGLLPIFIRVTVNGARIEFSTKRFTTSEKYIYYLNFSFQNSVFIIECINYKYAVFLQYLFSPNWEQLVNKIH